MNDQAMNEALDAAVNTTASDPSLFRASNGLVLRLKPVPQMVIGDADRRLKDKMPRPPKVFIEEKGRNEENPLDPDYIKAMEIFDYDRAMLAMRVYYILGTSIVDLAGLDPPESTEWSDRILAVDDEADIPEALPRRYFQWLKLYALPDEDATRLLTALTRGSGGTMQEDVDQAQASFRGNTTGNSVVGIRAAPEGEHRDRNAVPVGDDTRIRGEGSSSIRALPVGQVDDPVDLL